MTTCYECGEALHQRLVQRVVTVGSVRRSLTVKALVCCNGHEFYPAASTKAIDALRLEMRAEQKALAAR